MDFEMSKLKPHICEWLYVEWENVLKMDYYGS